MSEMYQRLAHSSWDCKYHVVFVPKRRRKVLFGQARRKLGEVFHPLARQGVDSVRINRHGVTNERVVQKGVADHLESESCECDREASLEALTGAYAGREIELRNCQFGGPMDSFYPEGKKATRDIGELVVTRRSRSSPGMHRNSMCENRETPLSPVAET